MAKCMSCGAKLLRDVVKKKRTAILFKNYRCQKCGSI